MSIYLNNHSKFFYRVYGLFRHRFLAYLRVHSWAPFSTAHLKSSWKVVGYYSNICDTIAPVGTPFQVTHYCSLHRSQLSNITDNFFSPNTRFQHYKKVTRRDKALRLMTTRFLCAL